MDISPWDYYHSLRHKSWNELSDNEKERMVLAAHLILDDCGTCSTLSGLSEFLQIHLPEISEPWNQVEVFLCGFREWQDSPNK